MTDRGNELYLSGEVARLRRELEAAQDVMGVLEDDALALRISLSCHYDNNDPLLNAINAYRDAVRERVKHD